MGLPVSGFRRDAGEKGAMGAFPDGFLWGAATSAQQIEGAARVDGRGPSIWDVFSRIPGRTWLGQTPDTACDHYRRFRDDVAIMRRMGLRAYRFSVSWPRVIPDGTGSVNAAGLDFYERLVDELIAADILPHVTLFHWDLPYALHCRGGWLNRASTGWFGAFAETVAARLSDRVSHWVTFNEPQIFAGMGYERGEHAPGLSLPFPELLRIGHHVLLAHGMASQSLRAAARNACAIGLAPHAVVCIPASDAPCDVEAARTQMFRFRARTCWSNAWWLDPVFLGAYPGDMLSDCELDMPDGFLNDLPTIHARPDFFGVNLYAGSYVRAGTSGAPEDAPWPVNIPLNAFKMVVTPEAMYWGVKWFFERYRSPVVITENGASCTDWVSLDGGVHDPQRIDYTARYLRELARAVKEGADVRGYFHWSLLDNFEWSEGYKERLGLVYVNFETQERIWKDSAHWYRRVIATNGESIFEQPLCAKSEES